MPKKTSTTNSKPTAEDSPTATPVDVEEPEVEQTANVPQDQPVELSQESSEDVQPLVEEETTTAVPQTSKKESKAGKEKAGRTAKKEQVETTFDPKTMDFVEVIPAVKESETWEEFYSPKRHSFMFKYQYQSVSGETFTCEARSLVDARAMRDEALKK